MEESAVVASRVEEVVAFPPDFMWGVATAAYQIEGSIDADGRGESIWDRFCTQAGSIADGSDGSEACQHYTRYREDVALFASLNVGAYRFSIAWPRVVPAGRGATNEAGLDFYDRLVDELVAAGIVPYPTLYHWDLPQALQDEGGWTNRATAEAFADYAEVVIDRLGDRVSTWTTLNEPFVSADHGYLTGEHAPGLRSRDAALAAAHHLLVGHGLAADRIRHLAPQAELAVVLNFTPVKAASDHPNDQAEARGVDDWENRWYVEPIAGDGYPASGVAEMGWDQREVLAGDLDRIAQPIDVLGVNYYTRQVISADADWEQQPEPPSTAMGWEIHPQSLTDALETLHRRHGFARYMITENGAAMPDRTRVGGRVDDLDRIDYLRSHLVAVHRARTAGVPVDGYFVWSAMDNFEWAHGYEKRFGIIEIDYASMRRIPKRSADWFARVAETGVVN